MSRGRAEAALLGNTIIWGTTFVLVKAALADISPLLFLSLRFSIAAAVLAVVFRRELRRPGTARIALKGGAITGFFLCCGYVLQTTGLRLTSAPKSAFLTGLSTVTVPFLAMAVYRIKPRAAEIAGVFTATAGMGLMTLPGVDFAHVNPGDLLTIGCAVSFAAHIVALGHYSEESGCFEVLSVSQVGTAALFSLALCGWAERPFLRWQPAVIWAILITGLLATALAFTIQAWAQRYTSSTRTALIYTLEPVFAWLTSYWLTGETLNGSAAAGAGLILGGVLLVELKPGYSRQHPSN